MSGVNSIASRVMNECCGKVTCVDSTSGPLHSLFLLLEPLQLDLTLQLYLHNFHRMIVSNNTLECTQHMYEHAHARTHMYRNTFTLSMNLRLKESLRLCIDNGI